MNVLCRSFPIYRLTFGHPIRHRFQANFVDISKQHYSRGFLRQLSGQASVPKTSISQYRRLLKIAKKEKYYIFGAIGCLFVSSAITMSVPFGIGKILDMIYATNDQKEAKVRLDKFCVVLCGIFLIGSLANYARVYLFSNASLRITKDLRVNLYKSFLNQEASWFDRKSTGELISRLSTDAGMVGNSLSQNVSDGLRNIVMTAAGVGMMVYTSPQLAFLGMCVVPCLAAGAVMYGKYVRKITRQLTDKYADVMKTGEERLGNVKTVKIFGREHFEIQLFLNKLQDALNLGYRETNAKAGFTTGLTGNVIIVSVLYYGGSLVTTMEMTLGTLISFIMYSAYTAISIGGLSNFYNELNKSIGSATRIWEIMDREYAIPVSGGLVPSTQPKGSIEFSDVSFCYSNRDDVPVLNNFILNMEQGTSTAVVGRSGSGKSTIGSLLLRLYDPQKGSILLDGIDIRTLDPRWLRKHIGAVNQEPILFSGTIRENILYGLDEGSTINESELEQALKDSHVDELISKFPFGINTMVGQRGTLLSGGQKQRIAIARALIRKPKILILDEATSALDAISEELIQSALTKLIKGRTVLTIAHRLSTIVSSDKIAVLEGGRIVEHGSYDSLIKLPNGVFRDLVKHQTFSVVQQGLQ